MLPGIMRRGFKDRVTIEPYVSQNSYGEAVYNGFPVEYPARVEIKSRRIAGSGGVEIAARGRVLLLTTTVPSTKDRMTLPTWAAPTQPPILAVGNQIGDGLDHITVDFG
jgi:hypothetical protein